MDWDLLCEETNFFLSLDWHSIAKRDRIVIEASLSVSIPYNKIRETF